MGGVRATLEGAGTSPDAKTPANGGAFSYGERAKNRYEPEVRLRARCRRTLSRLPQSRESHHTRLALRLSSKNTQPQPSPAQTLTLTSFGEVKSSAADRATGHKGLSSSIPPSSLPRSQPQP